MSNHDLKTWPEYFAALWNDSKTFEVRKADRDFQVGDTLTLREYDPKKNEYTGRAALRTVTYILREPSPFAFPGFVVMGFQPSHSRFNRGLKERIMAILCGSPYREFDVQSRAYEILGLFNFNVDDSDLTPPA